MGKRKHKRDDDHLDRKISRLVEKSLKEHTERQRRIQRSKSRSPRSSSDSESVTHDGHKDISDYEVDNLTDEYENDTSRPQSVVNKPSPVPVTKNHDLDALPPQTTEQSSASEMIVLPAIQPLNTDIPDLNQPSSSQVPQEILSILGMGKKVEPSLGEKIPDEISERWGSILLDGLAKEHKEALIERLLIPENFTLARAPRLNPEVAAVLTDTAKNRDKRLEKSQNQLGSGLAGLVNFTKDLIKSDLDKMDIISRLSEISQILLDLHYEDTINRRKLITPLLDKKFWTTIHGIKRDHFLFGEKLGENIKNTKDIERSSQQIRKPAQPQPQFQRKNPPPPGNYRAPPRQQTSVKPAPRYHETQSSNVTRRSTNQPRNRGAHSGRTQDRRRK